MQLPAPKNNLAKILLLLIEGKCISEQDVKQNGFRQRLSELRNDYDVPIRHVKEESVNEFSRPIWYYRHFLLRGERKAASKIYAKINKC